MLKLITCVMGVVCLFCSGVAKSQDVESEEKPLFPAPVVPSRVKLASDYIAVVNAETLEELKEHLSKNDFQNMVVLDTTDDTCVLEVLRNRRFRRLYDIFGQMSPEEAARESVELAHSKVKLVVNYCRRIKEAFEKQREEQLFGLGMEDANIHEGANASLFLVAKYAPQALPELEHELLKEHRAVQLARRESTNNGHKHTFAYFDGLVYSSTLWATLYSFILNNSDPGAELPERKGLQTAVAEIVRWDAPHIPHPILSGLTANVVRESHIVQRLKIVQIPTTMGDKDEYRGVIDALRSQVSHQFPVASE